MLRRLLLVAAAWIVSVPALAYHDVSYAERMRFCASTAFAYHYVLWKSVEELDVAIDAIVPTALGADGLRVTEAVQKVTADLTAGARDWLRTCIDEAEREARPDAAAAPAARIVELELGGTLGELDRFDKALREKEAALQEKLGRRPGVSAAALLRGWTDFVASTRADATALRTRAQKLMERTKVN